MIAAFITTNLLSSLPSDGIFVIGPILTIIVMLLFFTRALLTETPYWSKSVKTAFYVFAIPVSIVFLIVIGVRIALALDGQ